MIAWLLLLTGAAVGIGQAISLRRTARPGLGLLEGDRAKLDPVGRRTLAARCRVRGKSLLETPARLALVAAVLCAAAVAGHLPATAAGWAGGFALGTIVIIRRWS